MIGFLLVPVLTILSSVVGFLLDQRWLLPLLNAAPAYGILVLTLRRRDRRRTVLLMVWWAFWLAVSGVWLSVAYPARAEEVILNGTAYRDEMLEWLRTGIGRESTPSSFIPQHLLHAGVFCVLSLITASVASIVMGAMLMNYMSFHVGDVIGRCLETGAGLPVMLLAWNPWSMVRVVSFITLGVVLAEPLLGRLGSAVPEARTRWRWIVFALAGLLVDMAMKAVLAPVWPGLLAGCMVDSP